MKKDNLGVALVKRACKVCHVIVDAEIIMNTQLTAPNAKKVKEAHGKVVGWIDSNPYSFCDECLKASKSASFFITVDESKSEDKNNPWRTGGIFLVKNSAIKKAVDKEQAEDIIKHRACYIDDETAKQMGFSMEHLNEGS
jgi:hypothetical protein